MASQTELNQANKKLVWDFWHRLQLVNARATEDEATQAVQEFLHPELDWHGCMPLGEHLGTHAFMTHFWLPLQRCFHSLKREHHIFMGGESRAEKNAELDGRMWVGGTGVMRAYFEEDFVGIPANHKEVELRWGEFCRVQDGKIIEIFLMLDLVDLARQAGIRLLPPARGQEDLFPPPAAEDGVMLAAEDEQQSKATLDHLRQFVFKGLDAYDESELSSMGMSRWFHPDLKWYGPGGIGACLSFEEFETLHQKPWLEAFPDRKSASLDALIGEGNYTGGTFFAGTVATHRGEYLGHPPTGANLVIGGLDFWKREGDELIENWVFVDMISLFHQMGVDLLENLHRY